MKAFNKLATTDNVLTEEDAGGGGGGGDTSELEAKVTAIEKKIPNAASESNQLADKNFVNTGLSGKQSKLTFDATVTKNSGNPVTSDGIFSSIWGDLVAPPTGYTSLYKWCVAELANKISTSDANSYVKYTSATSNSIAAGEFVFVTNGVKNSFVFGQRAKATEDNCVALGYYAYADHKGSVVIVANPNPGDEEVQYLSHGYGTLNLASRAGMQSVFVQHMHLDAALAFLLMGIQESGSEAYNSFLLEYSPSNIRTGGQGYNVNDYFCHGGRLYKVLSTIEDGLEWEDVPASRYKEITLKDVLFDSPTFTGTPKTPNLTQNSDNSQVANKKYVDDTVRYTKSAGITLTPENDAATFTCQDRKRNKIIINQTFTTLNLEFPPAVDGKIRDFYLRVEVAAGVTAPALSISNSINLENPKGEVPVIADGGTDTKSTTLIWFSETDDDDTFIAKTEIVKAVTR